VNALQSYQEYLDVLFAPTDVIAFTFIHSVTGKTQNVFVVASEARAEKYFTELTKLNENFNVFAGMNPFKPELVGQSVGRTKENVAAVKRVYADADDDGVARFEKMLSSGKVPQPTLVLESSPGKRQIIWNAEGFTQETAEPLMRAIAEEFQTDKAVAETARVLRVPGFRNLKYDEKPEVKTLVVNPLARYNRSAFHVDITPKDGEKFEAKPKDWIYQPIIHGDINNALTRIAGWYINEKFVKDADVLFELLKGHADKQAYHKDGLTPFQCNMDEVRKIADGCIQRYRSKKLELTQAQAASTQPAQAQPAQPVDVSKWRAQFRSVGEMDDGPIVEVIHGVLQEGICFLGASPSDGKTLVSLAMAKAISTGEPLFRLPQFAVAEARTVIT
jgi:hypothetical protein